MHSRRNTPISPPTTSEPLATIVLRFSELAIEPGHRPATRNRNVSGKINSRSRARTLCGNILTAWRKSTSNTRRQSAICRSRPRPRGDAEKPIEPRIQDRQGSITPTSSRHRGARRPGRWWHRCCRTSSQRAQRQPPADRAPPDRHHSVENRDALTNHRGQWHGI